MNVAICDDNVIFLETFEGMVKRYDEIKAVRTFASPTEFLESITQGVEYDLVFMDIDWGSVEERTGLDLGEELCKKAPKLPIILVTGYNDRFAQHVMLTDANIIGYMTKPVKDEVLKRYLQKAKSMHVKPKYLVCTSHGTTFSIDMNEIVHMESHDHQLHICTESEEYHIYEKLNDVEKRLGKEFLRIHKSFLVNMNYVSKLEAAKVILRTGKDLPISRMQSKKVRERFFEFLGENL